VKKKIVYEETKPEYRDTFNSRREPTGKSIKRGDPIPDGEYIIATAVWVTDSSDRFLITRRTMNCSWMPGMWGVPGGGVFSGENSLSSAIRETWEETGIALQPEIAKLFCSHILDDRVYLDHWLFKQDFDITNCVLQADETMDARAATVVEILNMKEQGAFIGRKVLETRFDAFDMLIDTLL